MKSILAGILSFVALTTNAETWVCSNQNGKNELRVLVAADGTSKGTIMDIWGFGDIEISGGQTGMAGSVWGYDSYDAKADLSRDEQSPRLGTAHVEVSTDVDCVGHADYNYDLTCEISADDSGPAQQRL